VPPLPPEEKLVTNPPASTADQETISHGDQLFGRYCSVCHGESAVVGGTVPDLRASSFLGNDF
jgi:quinohemoprotein ethanol dehydrogenase